MKSLDETLVMMYEFHLDVAKGRFMRMAVFRVSTLSFALLYSGQLLCSREDKWEKTCWSGSASLWLPNKSALSKVHCQRSLFMTNNTDDPNISCTI